MVFQVDGQVKGLDLAALRATKGLSYVKGTQAVKKVAVFSFRKFSLVGIHYFHN